MRRFAQISLLLPLVAFSATGCLSDDDDAASADGGTTPVTTMTGGDATTTTGDGAAPTGPDPSTAANGDALAKYVPYRDLATHPGCSTKGLSYTPAVISGYNCAAKEYGKDDGSKPIVLLVHGNSSTPADYEICKVTAVSPKCVDTTTPMISETLVADGFHVYASDVRYDLVDDNTGMKNPALNYDHGWAVPIVQSLIEALINKYPTRKINIMGFSLGPTIIRDSLRRLHRAGKHPFAHVGQLYFASGGHHGVKSYGPPANYCVNIDSPMNTTMAGLAACQLGNLANYVLTPFETPLNGPSDAWDTPCSDGINAYGQANECDGNTVTYTTVVFKDQADGSTLDEFVDEASAHLNGATNTTVTTVDSTGYFFAPLFIHHYGAIRSAEGVAKAVAVLEK
jgi:hypothetical protein